MTRPAHSFEVETSTPTSTAHAHVWLAVQALRAVAARRKTQVAANADRPCAMQSNGKARVRRSAEGIEARRQG